MLPQTRRGLALPIPPPCNALLLFVECKWHVQNKKAKVAKPEMTKHTQMKMAVERNKENMDHRGVRHFN